MKKHIFFTAWALTWGFIIKTLWEDYAESKRIADEDKRIREETDRLIEQWHQDARDYLEIDQTIQRLLSRNPAEAMQYGLKILQRENDRNRRIYQDILNQ